MSSGMDTRSLQQRLIERLAECCRAHYGTRLVSLILFGVREMTTVHGDIDFIPTERYTSADAERAIAAARLATEAASSIIPL
jgi:hypothetical protein